MAGPPAGCLELLVLLQLLPHVLGGGGDEPDLAVLLGGEAERAHVGLVVHAGGQVPRRDVRQILQDGLVAGHVILLVLEPVGYSK